jgi:hypothetical protein
VFLNNGLEEGVRKTIFEFMMEEKGFDVCVEERLF